MGCKNSKTTTGEHVDYRNVSDSGIDYPPPYVPETSKIDIYNEEVNKDIQKRIDAMPKGTDGSYTTLLKYLSADATKEVHHVTAIYFWMKSQDYNNPMLDKTKAGDTPQGYMKMIKDGHGDLTSFFTIMCRRSEIPCMILHGIGKDVDYSIGCPEHGMRTTWTAVFADDEWHLAHIEWAVGSGKDRNQNEANSKASDFFFFTDPDEFITVCYPDQYQWQLLDRPITKGPFLNMPNFRPYFFYMDATLVAPKTGNVKVMNGKQEIEITFPKEYMDHVHLDFCVTSLSSEDATAGVNLDKFVFINRTSSKFIYEICFPQPGKFLFDICGDFIQGTSEPVRRSSKKPYGGFQRLCQFRIVSDKHFSEDDLDPLPECPDIGWGPGPYCSQLGLIPLTHFEGCIYMKPGDVRDLVFRMTRDLDVTCQLVHTFLPVYELVEQVKCDKLHDEVLIRVHIPEEGQYALKIYCREAGSKEFHEACVYLLRQRQRSRLPEKYRDRMLRARLEHHIKEHTSEQALEDAIEAFVCFTVPDHGELRQAHDKLKHYWEIKRELRTAIKGRNMHVVHKWLEKAKCSKYRKDLQDDITEGELLEEKLAKMGGHRHPIMKLDPHTMIEIRNYARPPMVVRDVMTSTYLLLGEHREDLEDWEQIQYLMAQPGKESLQKRIVCRRPEDVHIEIAEEADNLLQPYTLEKCRDVSNGICSFYIWNKQFIKEVRQKDAEEHERREKERAREEEKRRKEEEEAKKSPEPEPSYREPVQFVGRGDPPRKMSVPNKEQNGDKSEVRAEKRTSTEEDKHPFEVEQKGEAEEQPKSKFVMSPSKPSDGKQQSPVSYAGWKPTDS